MISVEDIKNFIDKGLANGSLKKESWIMSDGYEGANPIAGLESNKDGELVLIEFN